MSEADVCIVGAGYTGLSTALHLARAGQKVVVVEAARVGFGASGRNGGQIIHSYSRDLDVIERRHGLAQARALGAMAFEGAEVLRGLVAEHGIECDLKPGSVFAALTDKQVAGLREHQRLWERYGHRQLSLLDEAATRSIIRSERYKAALLDASGGHFHPLKLAQGEAQALCAIGGAVHEQSPALRIERGDGAEACISGPAAVKARFVVVACNAYLDGLEPVAGGALDAVRHPDRRHRAARRALARRAAVRPLRGGLQLPARLLPPLRRQAPALRRRRGLRCARSGAHRVDPATASGEDLPAARGRAIDYAWTGNFLLTLSRLPDVGRLADNIFYSQGCSGHGVTFTHLIGRVLAEAILGRPERMAIFERLPHYPFPGGQLLRVPLTALAAKYYDLRDRLGI